MLICSSIHTHTHFFSQPCIVEDCGELKPGEHDGVTGDDGTGDVYAEWPVDSEVDFSKVNNSIYNICSFLCRQSSQISDLNL